MALKHWFTGYIFGVTCFFLCHLSPVLLQCPDLLLYPRLRFWSYSKVSPYFSLGDVRLPQSDRSMVHTVLSYRLRSCISRVLIRRAEKRSRMLKKSRRDRKQRSKRGMGREGVLFVNHDPVVLLPSDLPGHIQLSRRGNYICIIYPHFALW